MSTNILSKMKRLLFIYCLLILGTIHLLAQKGLKADYFDGTQFDRYVATNYVDHIDFYWNQIPPVKGINPHECSIRYTGRLTSPRTGLYTFSARVDDGIRVWVGETLVINNWQLNDVGYSDGTIEMKADQFYDIKIEYFNALNEAELRLLWKLPNKEESSWLDKWWYGEEPVVVPAQYFAPPLEKEVELRLEPKLQAIVQPKLKPQLKPKPKLKTKSKPKPNIVKRVRLAVPQKKKVVDTIQRYIPQSVEFDQAKSEILAVSFRELDTLTDFLVRNPNRTIRIEGHTDNIGDMAKNIRLSERRSYAVAAYLVKKGVGTKQVSARGFGGTKPLVRSSKGKYHPENRRVEFIIE